jgi:hypothetical protein
MTHRFIRFPLGQTVSTPGALACCERHGVLPLTLLARHASGDWGSVCAEDAKANEQALQYGSRLVSSYDVGQGERVWVITEADRSVTTLLLPSEY